MDPNAFCIFHTTPYMDILKFIHSSEVACLASTLHDSKATAMAGLSGRNRRAQLEEARGRRTF